MSPNPTKAFILAAGMGTRLRPHTDHCPKPMVKIAGRSIIERSIEKLTDAGVQTVVVNMHHLADILQAHLHTIKKPEIVLSREEELLDTGGGIKKAMGYFGQDPFFILNGDALWDDGAQGPALSRLAQTFDPRSMDILILLQPKDKMGDDFVGDYDLMPDGRAIRNLNKSGGYMFAGIRIAAPHIFEGAPEGAFSFLSLMDKAQQNNRLFGLVHTDAWYHISTPADLARVDALFRAREGV